MTKILAIVFVLSITVPASAEETFAWPAGKPQTAANLASYGSVFLNISMDTLKSWRADDRAGAFKCQALRYGVTIAASEVLKRTIHRERPNGHDRMSMPSEHTALAQVSSGWRFSVGFPMAIGTGYFRHAANWHYLSDTALGGILGEAARRLC